MEDHVLVSIPKKIEIFKTIYSMNFYKPKVWIEKALGSQAAVGMSRVMGHLADIPLPKRILKPVTDLYTLTLGVDETDTVYPEDERFPFNRFFGRRLESEARPIDPAPDALTSPCDGQIVAMGRIDSEDVSFSIKSSKYTVASLLGTETTPKSYVDGAYAVIYLHPRDYHRVHVPFDGTLTTARHIPGSRFPVTSWCEKLVDNIYDKNERMVFMTALPSDASLAVIMVAALGVGNMETAYDPGVDPRQAVCRERHFDPPIALERGRELGAFLVGSTVVLLGSNGAIELDERLEWGPIKMGQKIGKVLALNDRHQL
jgi:phosphatidylserine decarboxylase